MEYIKEALIKAKAESGPAALREHADRVTGGKARRAMLGSASSVSTTPPIPPTWSPPKVTLSVSHLEKNRIVSYAASDPAHVAFNLLRTRVRRVMDAVTGSVLVAFGVRLATERS